LSIHPDASACSGPRTPVGCAEGRVLVIAGWLAAVLGATTVAQAAPPHQHGVAQLDAAIEGPALTLSISVPLDSLLGFERAPRTAAEKQAAAQVIDRLKRSADVVLPDPAAQCESTDVTLVSSALGLGAAAPDAGAAGGEAHADVDATYTFRCREPGRLAFVDLHLMKAYTRIGRVEAQVVGARSQGRQVVKRPAMRLAWPGP
jgi:Protein of unknown function (DUF2796)